MSHVLQPQQLKMFMTPEEIKGSYSPIDNDRGFRMKSGYDSDETVWANKRADIAGTPFEASVQSHGVEHPVPLTGKPSRVTGKPMIAGGHHRIEAAKPGSLIPVEHFTDTTAAVENPYRKYR
jgi:hypothetical protein